MRKDKGFKVELFFWIVTFVIMGLIVFLNFTPNGRAVKNNWSHRLKKVDDATLYDTKKKVEDTARSMIASYESDKLIYEQYKNSDSIERASWGDNAMMRANKTAASYNEFILMNSYIWESNIPEDLKQELPYIRED